MQRRRDERGAAVVEFALILPILVLFVFGIIEFGQAYSARIQLTGSGARGRPRRRPGPRLPSPPPRRGRPVSPPARSPSPTRPARAAPAPAPARPPPSSVSTSTTIPTATVTATLPVQVRHTAVRQRHLELVRHGGHAMRRVTHRRRDERGAMVIFLAAFSVVMIGMAALVIDVGSLLDEKRQLQNGADAGALAVAQQLRRRRLQPGPAPTRWPTATRRTRRAPSTSVAVNGKDVTVTTSHQRRRQCDPSVLVRPDPDRCQGQGTHRFGHRPLGSARGGPSSSALPSRSAT